MPKYLTHVMAGAILSATLWSFQSTMQIPDFDYPKTVIFFVFGIITVVLYSQLPDIDSDASKVNKFWNTAMGLFGIYALITKSYTWFGVLAVASIVCLEWVKHRGFLHTWAAGLVFSAPIWFYNPFLAVIAFACYELHIIIDEADTEAKRWRKR